MNKDLKYSILIFVFYFSILLLLPVTTSGYLKNMIFSNSEILLFDDASANNFNLLLHIIQNHTIGFDQNFVIRNRTVQENFDFFHGVGGKYFLINDPFYLIFFIPQSYFFANNAIAVFKIVTVSNFIIASLALVVFYLLLRKLDLKREIAVFGSFSFGMATGLLIFTRYFTYTVTSIFLLVLSLFLFFNFWKHKNLKNLFLLSVSLSLLSLMRFPSLFGIVSIPVFLVILSPLLLLVNLKKISKSDLLVFIVPLIFIFLVPEMLWFNMFTGGYFINPHTYVQQRQAVSIFKIFPTYVNAEDFDIYGYYNQSSAYKLERQYALIYSFANNTTNGIFLHSYGLFASFFSSRGIIFNSPFLFASFVGMIYYFKENTKIARSFLLILFLMAIGLAWLVPIWHGGYGPRYARTLLPAVPVLIFFSFYALQQNKNRFFFLIFFLLFLVSALNIISLSIRTDWNLERTIDAVSYDLVLWPLNF